MASKKREPEPRYEAFSFVHNNQFYVCQGKRFNRFDYKKRLRSCRRIMPRDPSKGHGDCEDQFLPLQRYDFSSAQWSGVSPVCMDREPEEQRYWRELTPVQRDQVGNGTDVCCAVLGNCAYTFGGNWPYGYAVHELNLETMVWQRVKSQNREEGPMQKRKAGMIASGDEALCVFGGTGLDDGKSRHQPGATYLSNSTWHPFCITNEIHLFHITTGTWYSPDTTGTWSSPETTGPRPPPCIEFSFTKIDLTRAVLFGGRTMEGLFLNAINELHILDMNNWHWSGVILPFSPADLWPHGMTQHSACALFKPTPSFVSEGSSKELSHSLLSDMSAPIQNNPQLFVLWGIDTDTYSIPEAWILDINSISWKQVKLLSGVVVPRRNASLGCYHRSSTEAELVVFGGIPWTSTDTTVVGATTLFYMGVKTLYHSCVGYIAERYELYQPLLQQMLPPHIQTDIRVERDKRVHYHVVQL